MTAMHGWIAYLFVGAALGAGLVEVIKTGFFDSENDKVAGIVRESVAMQAGLIVLMSVAWAPMILATLIKGDQ